jgi:hypothetical protein
VAAPPGGRAVSSERIGAALAGEPGKNAATIVAEDLAAVASSVSSRKKSPWIAT